MKSETAMKSYKKQLEDYLKQVEEDSSHLNKRLKSATSDIKQGECYITVELQRVSFKEACR